jgi:serine/threonine-protein kinase RsbW
MADVEIEIPSRSVYVGVARLAISSLARTAGFSEDIVDDLKIAVGEACTTAVLANEEAGVQAPVSISWTEVSGRVTIEVGDRGTGEVSDAVVSLDDSGSAAARAVLSMALLQSLVDECELTRREGGGTSARLVITAR